MKWHSHAWIHFSSITHNLFPGTQILTLRFWPSQLTGNGCLFTARVYLHGWFVLWAFPRSPREYGKYLLCESEAPNIRTFPWTWTRWVMQQSDYLTGKSRAPCNNLFITVIVITPWSVRRHTPRGLMGGHQSSFEPPPEGSAKCSLDLGARLDCPVVQRLHLSAVLICTQYTHTLTKNLSTRQTTNCCSC